MGDLTVAAKRYIKEDKKRAREYQLLSRTIQSWKRDALIWGKFTNYLGPADPWKASPEDIAGWCAWLVEEGVKPHSIATYVSVVNLYFERLGRRHCGHENGSPFLTDTGDSTDIGGPATSV